MLLGFRLRQPGSIPALSYLQYFLIFAHMFGYYGLWSHILLPRFLYIENTDYLAAVISQMGIPFFVVSMIMLWIWALKMQNTRSNLFFQIGLLLGFAAVCILLKRGKPIADNIHTIYSLAGFIVPVIVASIILMGKNNVLTTQNKYLLIAIIAIAGLIHLTYFTTLAKSDYYETIFAFTYFLSSTAIMVVYIYSAEIEQPAQSFGNFNDKYGITNREADIIQGIYAGKTNQEIADGLFITLQTVKDHSSRIYQKTHVKNRAQLTALLREFNLKVSPL